MLDISFSNLVYWVGLPLAAWIFKTFIMNRLEQLEQKVETMVNEQQVRTIIADKIDPIQADVKEIKTDLRSLFLLQLNEKLKKDNQEGT